MAQQPHITWSLGLNTLEYEAFEPQGYEMGKRRSHLRCVAPASLPEGSSKSFAPGGSGMGALRQTTHLQTNRLQRALSPKHLLRDP